ncbi:MAG TPA: N-acetylmuramoyl-L-alanine amidase [Candidatus Mediterraneibacter avicola]|nr:N-acetylmuramoyl-L-alanine amidase [Candidatus Mediterraneibacter avicola]
MTHIFVIAGHGAGDPGASGNGYTEAERVRALAAKIKAYGGDAVTVGDTSRNWYADNGISTLSISKSWQIIELHMDSASASARGGHVIINSGFEPDKYDTALAAFISGILPGRAQTIVKRNDLANPKRAAAKGYPYRLLECGFISNTQDVKIFNEKTDEIAKGILNVFGIGTSASGSTDTSGESKPVSATPQPDTLKAGRLAVDGKWGRDTTFRLQKIFGTVQDGAVSNQRAEYRQPGCYTGWEWENDPSGYSDLIKAIQRKVGSAVDGWIGPDTIRAMQKYWGTVQDGKISAVSDLVKAIQKWANSQAA